MAVVKHRLWERKRTLGVVVWQPVGFCRRIGWINGGWEYAMIWPRGKSQAIDEDDDD